MTANYEQIARENGWTVVDKDPGGWTDQPCLYHPQQDRVWPLGDWKGACEDLGLLDAQGQYIPG